MLTWLTRRSRMPTLARCLLGDYKPRHQSCRAFLCRPRRGTTGTDAVWAALNQADREQDAFNLQLESSRSQVT